MADAEMRTWEVMICLPGLNIPHYFRSPTEPTYEQINAVWMERSQNPLKRTSNDAPLRDSYPGIAWVKEIKVHDLTVGGVQLDTANILRLLDSIAVHNAGGVVVHGEEYIQIRRQDWEALVAARGTAEQILARMPRLEDA